METTKQPVTAKLTSFFAQCRRVWMILKKPSSEEFKTVAKVSALGILIMGALGFIIADIIRVVSNLFS